MSEIEIGDFEYDQDPEWEYQRHDPLVLSEFSKIHKTKDWACMREFMRIWSSLYGHVVMLPFVIGCDIYALC